jgi:proline iminopeptidase
MPSAARLGLHPPLEPFRRGQLPVGQGHEMYFEQAGNVHGQPVLIVHGGPGGGFNPTMRRFHDPARHHIILFDQRGAGQSTPHASLEHNTTQHLIDDIERLRQHLGVSRWQLFGGSWGSTLALLYAQAYPDRVDGLILRSIFLMRQSELDWFYKAGANWLFPEAYQSFLDFLPRDQRVNPIAGYHRLLTSDDPAIQIQAARAWSRWEGSTLSLLPEPERLKLFEVDRYALAFARIECHYFHHRGFLAHDNQILADMPKIAHIAGTIIHGRYDVVTPFRSALDLHKAWPASNLIVIPDAGHAMTEPGMIDALVMATRSMAMRAA